ncbi:MAG: ferredoxin-thioredoxin reductase catalytic domain-containing protein [Candidatus Aminicenantaceae bacterium]
MRKYWRCHVCNDIHYGIKPPEICPTCSFKNAYVEISSAEAKKIQTGETEMDKEKFRQAIEEFTEKNEFQVNPNSEKVNMLIDGVFNCDENHGMKYCPCRLIAKDFEEDLKLVCPCNFLIHETYKDKEDGECWCGLFVRRKK